MAGDQAVRLQSRATIRDMGEIEVKLLVELEAEEMRWRTGRVGGVAEFAAIGLGPGHELREIVSWNARMRDKHQRRLHAFDQRQEVVDLPTQIVEHARIDFGERLRADPDQLSVRRRVDYELRGDVAG